MTFTYGGDPSLSARDAVRFEIGDTDSQYPILQDNEILYTLTVEANALGAAARCCEVIVRKLSREPNTRIGRTQVTMSTAMDNFRLLAKELRNRAAQSNAQLYAGGINDEVDWLIDSQKAKKDYFARGLHDNTSS